MSKDSIKIEEVEKITVTDESGEVISYEVSKDLVKAMEDFKKKNKKKSSDYEINRVCYPTGFVTLDLMIGKDFPSKVEGHEGEIIKSRGLRDGIMLALGGRTHRGKSVFAMNIAGNIVRPFIKEGKPAWIEYFTPEEGLEPGWLMTCAGLGGDSIEKGFIRITHRHAENTSTEGLFRLVKNIYELKTSNSDKFMYDTTDMWGRPVKKYYPTVLICDSWSMTTPKALQIEDEASNTFHARRNNINGMFLENMRPLMLEANIMFIPIVHVGEKIGMDAKYTPREYANLGKNVAVSGGKIFHFETELGIVLDKFIHVDSEKVSESLGIDCPNSRTVEALVYKSRLGMYDSTTKFSILFDPNFGFNPLYSLYVDMFELHPILGSAGAYKYINGYPDDKFFRKDFFPKFENDAEFRRRVSSVYSKQFEKYTRFVDNLPEVQKTRTLLDSIF